MPNFAADLPKKPSGEIDWREAHAVMPYEASETRDYMKELHRAQQARDAKGLADFKSAFYREYPDLVDDDELVTARLNQHLRELAPMEVGASRARLAEIVHGDIDAVMQRHGGSGGGRSRVTSRDDEDRAVMSGSPEHGQPGRAAPSNNITSIGDLIRARNERRRNANFDGPRYRTSSE